MRKVTGYIGALIIVFALMGSILAGYALNINGQSVVVNEYENVTDVSGLYSHTDQKTYIDYNPASNYTGYDYTTYYSDTGMAYYKNITGSNTTFTVHTNGDVTVNNTRITAPNINRLVPFYCEKAYIQHNTGWTQERIWAYDVERADITTDVTVTVSGNHVEISGGGYSEHWDDCRMILRLADATDYDYYGVYPGSTATYTAYYSDRSEIATIAQMTPKYGGSSSSSIIMCEGEHYYTRYVAADWTGFYNRLSMPADGWPYDETEIADDLFSADANFQTTTSDDWDSTGNTKTIELVFAAYPATARTDNVWLNLNYTESARVNNYPLPRVDGVTTSEETINISDLSGITNYANLNQYGKSYPVRMGWAGTDGQYGATTITNIDYWMPYTWFLNNNSDDIPIINYKLSDILTAGANVPVGTTTIKIDLSSNNRVTYDLYMDNGVTNDFDLNLPCINTNNYIINTNANVSSWGNILDGVTNEFGKKHYALYDVASGIVEVYTYDGVKINTLTAETCYIVSSQISSSFDYSKHIESRTTGLINGTPGNYDKNIWDGAAGNFNNPTASSNDYTTDINLTYYVSTSAQKYIDITKGFSILPNNTSVNWNNQYENGIINILFRAENTNGIYHNDIVVSGNTISVDYSSQRYSVTINGGSPVDVGKWRNIVLDIDLLNGIVNVNPVRTFNSYTNVLLDSASIYIGTLTDSAPTNSISWLRTDKSFKFNIYSTNVFLNTYDTVMVDPSLDITDYFTDLNDFYRLDLYNFSIYGNSITVNGTTGTVSGNTITMDEDTFILKDVSIVYADGHAYFKDSYTSLDLGEITTNDIIFGGVWYFETTLLKGFVENKQTYEWNWSDFIFDNTQFCIFYIGFAFAGLVIARKFCTMSVIDYVVFVTSIIVALSIQVIA